MAFLSAPAPPAEANDPRRFHTLVGRNHLVLLPTQHRTHALLRGHFSNVGLREGMNLHCTDIVQLQDTSTQVDMHDQGLKVLIKLEGQADVFLDDRRLPFDAPGTPRSGAQGAVLALQTTATFRRNARAGQRQRMVVLTLTPAWLEAAQIALPAAHVQHLAMHYWQPTPRAVALTQQQLHPGALGGMLGRLHQESRALELAAEALGHLLAPATARRQAPLSASALARMQRLQDLLDSGEADTLDMQAIAQNVACNATTLQQQFRQLHGQPIFDYLRTQRLQRAAHALRQRGISVGDAAEMAGYTSQANFSTAFLRHFGFSPKHARQRL